MSKYSTHWKVVLGLQLFLLEFFQLDHLLLVSHCGFPSMIFGESLIFLGLVFFQFF